MCGCAHTLACSELGVEEVHVSASLPARPASGMACSKLGVLPTEGKGPKGRVLVEGAGSEVGAGADFGAGGVGGEPEQMGVRVLQVVRPWRAWW